MVVYHSLNYTKENHLAFKYLSFLPPSFIFITGYLIATVYFARAATNQSGVQQRLLVRGGKLLLLFTLLNVLASLLLKRGHESEGFNPLVFFDHWQEIYITGSGRFAVFEVLLPIAYLLILSPAVIWAGHRQQLSLPIITVTLVAACILLESQGYYFPNLNFLSAGTLGMLAGRVPFQKIAALGQHVMYTVVAYAAYFFLGMIIGQDYLVQTLGAAVALALIFSLCSRFRVEGWPHTLLIRLGQYSLVSYIFQIGVLQILSRLMYRPAPFSPGGLFLFTATLLLTVACVQLIEWARPRSTALEKLYKAVFA